MSKPLTKEEIVRKLSDGWVGGMTPGDEQRIVYPAMDIWGKQEAISFKKFWDNYDPPIGKFPNDDELYQLYLDSLTK